MKNENENYFDCSNKEGCMANKILFAPWGFIGKNKSLNVIDLAKLKFWTRLGFSF